MTRTREDVTSRAGAADARVAAAVQLACLLEVSAPKPGNVSPGRPFSDTRFEDFLASAAAIGMPFATLRHRPLGQTVRIAVDATARWVGVNTNLGMVLLLAPLAYAARACLVEGNAHVRLEPGPLRECLRAQLQDTTIDDAREVYEAIRRASPGGLGRAEAEDVRDTPTRSLVEVMRLAQARDDIAHEYVTAFSITFDVVVPALSRARRDGLAWDEAVVETFLTLLAQRPDTHIARRAGSEAAAEVSRWAIRALQDGGVRSAVGRRTIEDMDRAIRDSRNLASPGTTADVTTAAIFVVLMSGEWHGRAHEAERLGTP